MRPAGAVDVTASSRLMRLPFDEELPVEGRECGNVEVFECVLAVGVGDSFLRAGNDLGLVRGGGASRERQPREVPRQADARGHDDIRLRASTAKPFAQVRE